MVVASRSGKPARAWEQEVYSPDVNVPPAVQRDRATLFRELVERNGLDHAGVAIHICASSETVRKWLTAKPTPDRRWPVPLYAIKLLALSTGTKLPPGWDKGP